MIESLLRQYGYIVLFIGSILEGDGTLAVAAFMAHRGYLSLSLVLAVSVVASVLANEGLYHAARLRGTDAFKQRIASNPRYAKLQSWVGKRSGLLLLLSRFLWGFRIVIPAACGVVGMTPIRFFLTNVTGAVIWALVVGLIGYGCSQFFHGFSSAIQRHEGAGLTLLGAVAIGSALIWHRCDIRGLWHALIRPAGFGPEIADRLSDAASRGRIGFWRRLSSNCDSDLTPRETTSISK